MGTSTRNRMAVTAAAVLVSWSFGACCVRGKAEGDPVVLLWRQHSPRSYSETEVVTAFANCSPALWVDLAFCVFSRPHASRPSAALASTLLELDPQRSNEIWGAWDELVYVSEFELPGATEDIVAVLRLRNPGTFLKALRELVARRAALPEAMRLAGEVSSGLKVGRVYSPPEMGGFWSDYSKQPYMMRLAVPIDLLLRDLSE